MKIPLNVAAKRLANRSLSWAENIVDCDQTSGIGGSVILQKGVYVNYAGRFFESKSFSVLELDLREILHATEDIEFAEKIILRVTLNPHNGSYKAYLTAGNVRVEYIIHYRCYSDSLYDYRISVNQSDNSLGNWLYNLFDRKIWLNAEDYNSMRKILPVYISWDIIE